MPGGIYEPIGPGSGAGGGNAPTFLFVVGPGNTLAFYFSTTGSNSNDGLSPATAFADPQFGCNYIAANVNFASGNVTLNDASGGSYAGFDVPVFIGGGLFQIYGAGSASTSCGGISGTGCPTLSSVQGATIVASGGNALAWQGSGGFGLGDSLNGQPTDLIFDLTGGANTLLQAFGYFEYFCNDRNSATILTSNSSINAAISLQFGASFIDTLTWTINSSGTTPIGNAWCLVEAGSFYSSDNAAGPGASYTVGTGSVTGRRYNIVGGSSATATGGANNLGADFFPGNAQGFVDGASDYDGYPGVVAMAGIPTTSDISAGCYGVFEDTNTNDVYLVANAAGTIVKAQLS